MMIDREKVIKGLVCCCQRKVCIYDDTLKECPYWELCGKHEDAFEDCTSALAQDALALLKAQDAELERLKNCRAECKIECLLEEYNKVVAERDALRKAQEPVAPEKRSFLCAGECEYESTPLMNVCGACGGWLPNAAPRAKYCPQCGRAVKWE